MKTKLAKILAAIIVCFGMAGAVVAPVFAGDPFCDNIDLTDPYLTQEAKEAMGCDLGEDAFPETIKGIISAVIAVGGLVAVIYVIIGGYGYMTSQGDSAKLQKAKTTILYAVIGIIICALAFVIVVFAIDGLSETATPQADQSTSSQP